jgi:hypothetical protein
MPVLLRAWNYCNRVEQHRQCHGGTRDAALAVMSCAAYRAHI